MSEATVKIHMPGLQRQVVLQPGTYWAGHDDQGKIYFWNANGELFKGEPSDYVTGVDDANQAKPDTIAT